METRGMDGRSSSPKEGAQNVTLLVAMAALSDRI